MKMLQDLHTRTALGKLEMGRAANTVSQNSSGKIPQSVLPTQSLWHRILEFAPSIAHSCVEGNLQRLNVVVQLCHRQLGHEFLRWKSWIVMHGNYPSLTVVVRENAPFFRCTYLFVMALIKLKGSLLVV